MLITLFWKCDDIMQVSACKKIIIGYILTNIQPTKPQMSESLEEHLLLYF